MLPVVEHWKLQKRKLGFNQREILVKKYTVRKREKKKINNPGNSSHAGIALFHRNFSVLDIIHRINKSVVIVFCHLLQKTS